ncbi:SDR family NAD(P)-dependent oxidoreductase [Streptomyces niveus]|nr:SDR family NAD(P)-dependent oxidoreductase [Streptomyces niveus]
MKDLQGKRVLVTGGSRGIGAAIALTLARNGADVAISYERAADRAQDIVDQIDREGQHGIAVQANSADPDANERLVEHAVRDLGGLDILVNNAGTIRHGDLVDLSPDDISTVLHVNVRGTVLTTRGATWAVWHDRRGAGPRGLPGKPGLLIRDRLSHHHRRRDECLTGPLRRPVSLREPRDCTPVMLTVALCAVT